MTTVTRKEKNEKVDSIMARGVEWKKKASGREVGEPRSRFCLVAFLSYRAGMLIV